MKTFLFLKSNLHPNGPGILRWSWHHFFLSALKRFAKMFYIFHVLFYKEGFIFIVLCSVIVRLVFNFRHIYEILFLWLYLSPKTKCTLCASSLTSFSQAYVRSYVDLLQAVTTRSHSWYCVHSLPFVFCLRSFDLCNLFIVFKCYNTDIPQTLSGRQSAVDYLHCIHGIVLLQKGMFSLQVLS